MNLLNKPISSFGFADIVEFCEQGHIEGIQLDYKKDLPEKGLAKHFAAFSNTRGGVIIIGVDEDRKTGKPSLWDGVSNEGKLVDRIHQYAANVEPLPRYDVHITDEKNSKAFILSRIFEGDRTPYYVQNDANLWVRTGNVSNPIDIASPDAAELLFGKKQKAELARNNYLRRAQSVFDAAVRRARGKAAQISERSMCTVIVQPYYPRKALIAPYDLLSSVTEIRAGTPWGKHFPLSDRTPEPIQDGILRFEQRENGYARADQIYSTGLVYCSEDILKVDEDGRRHFAIYAIALNLFLVLEATRKYYQRVGYQGGIEGQLSLDGTENTVSHQILPQGWRESGREPHITLESEYKWGLELDTAILSDANTFRTFYLTKIKEICWGLGYPTVKDDLLDAFLREIGWNMDKSST